MPSRTGPSPSTDSAREVFGSLVDAASSELGHRPSPPASRYLVDLLEGRVRALSAGGQGRAGQPETLAESLVEALRCDGAERLARLRALGDRALFQAGFFGESLQRRVVGVSYYSEIGQTAYHRVSVGTGSEVFRELATGFPEFVELLAEVGGRARGSASVDLLRLYDRYRETGCERVRRRLARHGLIVPEGGGDSLQ